MRKSKLIAILLAMVMMITSLGVFTVYASGKTASKLPMGGSEETESGAQTPVYNAQDVATWLSYLTYNDTREVDHVWSEENVEELFRDKNDTAVESVNTAYAASAGIVIVTFAKNVVEEQNVLVEGTEDQFDTEDVIVAEKGEYRVYDANTLEVLFTETYLDVDTSKKSNLTLADDKDYTFTVSANTGVILITRKTYEAVVVEEETTYEPKYAYNLMMNGELISETWETSNTYAEAQASNTVNHFEVTWGNTVYVMKDKEVIATFEKGMQHLIPDFTDASGTWFSHAGYTYLVNEKPFQAAAVSGDLVMGMFPGVSFRVLDKDFNAVAEYESRGDGIMGYGVLDNGNIFVSGLEYLDKDAAVYDAIAGEQKINIYNVIVNVADGSVTELDGKYLLQNIYTNATADINTPLNMNTNALTLGNTTVKEGKFLACIAKVKEDGTMDTLHMDFVVMNNDGSVEKDLPKLVANQYSYVGLFTEDKPVVNAVTVGNYVNCYEIDTATGKPTKFFNMSNSDVQGIQLLDNDLMVYNDKLYTTDGEEEVDLAEYDSYEVYGDIVVAKSSDSYYVISSYIPEEVKDYGNSNDYGTVYLPGGYYDGGSYEYQEDSAYFTYGTYSDAFTAVYNKFGELVISEDYLDNTITLTDTQGVTATCYGELELIDVIELDGALLVHAREVYEVTYYSGSEMLIAPEYDVYYVLK